MSVYLSLPLRTATAHEVEEQFSREQEARLHQWYLNTYGEDGELLFQSHIQEHPPLRFWRKRRDFKRIPSTLIDQKKRGSIRSQWPVVSNGRQLHFGRNRLFRTDSGGEEVRMALEPVTRGELVSQPFINRLRDQTRQKDNDLILTRNGIDLAIHRPVSRTRNAPQPEQVSDVQELHQPEKSAEPDSGKLHSENQPRVSTVQEQQSRIKLSYFLNIIRKIIHFVIHFFAKLINWLTGKHHNSTDSSQKEPLIETIPPPLHKPTERELIELSDREEGFSSDDELLDLF